jgi:arginyl-tRNA synthetase
VVAAGGWRVRLGSAEAEKERGMWGYVRNRIADLVREALRAAVRDGSLRLDAIPPVPVQPPADAAHGDLACTVALGLARAAKMPPRAVAETIVAHLDDDADVERVEVAGAGFINFFLSPLWRQKALARILASGSAYGTSSLHAGKTALVEFVSANPTGPLTVGHGRQAAIGDTIARLMEAVGYAVTREYYFNDAGRQMHLLAESVRARYLELLGRQAAFPEDGYQGDYIRDIAHTLVEAHGDALAAVASATAFGDAAVEAIFTDIRRTLARMGITFDGYYNERSLYANGHVDAVLAELRRTGAAYEKDGAVWFRATDFGRAEDRVLVRSRSDEPTYRLPDIAYHVEKIRRGFDAIVDVFGSDHIDEYPDVLAALRALGYETGNIRVLIHQFVTLTRGGETVKMSTRRANFVTVDELMDEVGEDALRLFFVLRSPGSHLNFDIELAKQASNENPVYYLQYAHARIASIFRQAEERGIVPPANALPDFSLLGVAEEAALMKACAQFPEVVASAAEDLEPHRLPHYLHDVATAFHLFYDRHRVLDAANLPLTHARMLLARAAQVVVANGLRLMGVRAPDRM